jgi:protein O-mannosyl-transferase
VPTLCASAGLSDPETGEDWNGAPPCGYAHPVTTSPRDRVVFAILLSALVVVAFWPVLGNGFVNFDDENYVAKNPHVLPGLEIPGLGWAWTATRAANWHPLTWISHMLDCQLYGTAPWGHHLSSLLFHLASTLLLFLALERMTGAAGRSAFAAALFGVHPLHVESVAWIAERKDVLSTFFWMLAILVYAGTTKAPTVGRRLGVVAAFAAGLASKPMLVTFPFTLLLLDFWPLGRWRQPGGRGAPGSISSKLVRDKAPLFAMAAASSVATLLVQRHGHAVRTLEQFPLAVRISNALVSYVTYLGKTVWPSRLAVFYPYPRTARPVPEVAAAAVVLLLATLLAFRLRRTRPYVLFGWLWYLGTLVPVIGVIQVGGQAMADRYTYVPLIGIFIAVSWGSRDLAGSLSNRLRKSVARGDRVGAPFLVLPAAILVTVVAACANLQAAKWKDSITLFEHAVAVTGDNWLARNNLGSALMDQGWAEEALGHCEEAVRLRPLEPMVHSNLGRVLAALGRPAEARQQWAEALRLDPRRPEAHYGEGLALVKEGRVQDAVREYESALAIDPEDPEVHNNLGSALARLGRVDEAIEHFGAALRWRPDYGVAHGNLAAALFVRGRLVEAWSEIRKARRFGFEPPPELVRDLARQMPDPGQR